MQAKQIRVKRGKTEASMPLTVEEVSTALHTGDLKPTDEYWSDGLQQWRPLAEIERGPLGGGPDRSTVKLQRYGKLPMFSVVVTLVFLGFIGVCVLHYATKASGGAPLISMLDLIIFSAIGGAALFFVFAARSPSYGPFSSSRNEDDGATKK